MTGGLGLLAAICLGALVAWIYERTDRKGNPDDAAA